jgi:Protein of unknown function (DUF3631)
MRIAFANRNKNRNNRNTPIMGKLESYLNSYMTFPESGYALPLALWIIGTYFWSDCFDAFPYLTVSAPTKNCGKSRLAELLSFSSNNPVLAASCTPAAIYRTLAESESTFLFDEAEKMSSEVKDLMHSVINSGYRRGQTIRRAAPEGGYDEYPTYCPKAFFSIGDLNDTLRSRSIVIHLRRAGMVHERMKFYFQIVQPQGGALRKEIQDLSDAIPAITESYVGFKGAEFLTDREEEIWTPLFVLCRYFAPTRELELQKIAADMAAEKTAPAMGYKNLLGEEKKAEDEEYAIRLLRDTGLIMNGRKVIASVELVDLLREMPTGPWRKFRGTGLTMNNLASLFGRFGLRPGAHRIGYGRGSKAHRSYLKVDVIKALSEAGV